MPPSTFRGHALLACLALTLAGELGAQSTFYVSGSGSDANPGTSPGDAWRTIARVNQQFLLPGDTVLFEGGNIFRGTLALQEPEGGERDRPITFASYGRGPGVLAPGTGGGFTLWNVAGIRIADLTLVGAGIDDNDSIGISFYADLPGDVKLTGIRVEGVHVTGFGRGGLSIGAYNGRTGFQDVSVTDSLFDCNGNNGMAVWGAYDPSWGQSVNDYPHRFVTIARNVFSSNWGDPSRTHATGSGLEVAQAAFVRIEGNEAFDNGRLNTDRRGGPIGIWVWDVLYGVIQGNESHHNHSQTLDGGGFDLDGGSTRCVLQYNYSHDNDGSGFLLAQFPGGARPMSDVTVRYNVSERDGGLGEAAAIQIWSGDPLGPPIQGAQIYNNTVYVEPKAPGGTAKAFRTFGDGDIADSWFANNIFFVDGAGAWLGELATARAPVLAGNLYFARNAPFVLRDRGVSYASLGAWRTGTGQETFFGTPTGLETDPLLTAPGTGGTLGDPAQLTSLDAYRLLPASPLFDAGIPIPRYGFAIGPHDFFDAPVPQGQGLSVGAHEGP